MIDRRLAENDTANRIFAELKAGMENLGLEWQHHHGVAMLSAIQRGYEAGMIEGHRVGLKEGIDRFAWWKDGVQYVGTCGTTLKAALAEVEGGPS